LEAEVATVRLSRLTIVFLAVFAAISLVASSAWAGGATVAYSFEGDEGGEYPSTDLVIDSAGNLYGTTVQGGDFGGGTVFQLAPSIGGWTHAVLYSFKGGADGGQPYGGVALDAQGNLYGTAVVGGTFTGSHCVESGCGVAYKLTKSGSTWTQHVIHTFTGGADGYGPGAGLTVGADGSVYGMTPTGGGHGLGVIYQMKARPGGGWRFRVIHTFTGGKDGGTGSAGRLLPDGAGNLFGVATVGGAHGSGVVFKLGQVGGNWRLKPLYAFKGQPDAGFPYGALISDGSGHLFGTTYYDGANDLGAVYELAWSQGTWHERVLYSFKGGADGASPISNLNLDPAGNLYGTTSEGGGLGCGCGTIFKLTPGAGGTWTESVAYRFMGAPDGGFPYNGMVADGSGSFYGATVHGGIDDEGSVYQFTP
jgi:uncharacterized repeat protein (TIGR03803 family)